MTTREAKRLGQQLAASEPTLIVTGTHRLVASLLWAVDVTDTVTGRHYSVNSLPHWQDYVAPAIEAARTSAPR